MITKQLDSANFQQSIRAGDRVTILVPAGLGRALDGVTFQQAYVQRTGRAVMPSSAGGWVLNMGGRYGTPGIATADNTIRIRRSK